MKLSSMRYSMALCALLLTSVGASAQSSHGPDKPTKEDGSTIRVDTDLVSIEAAVSDKRGANVRQMLGRPGEVWAAESGADRLVVFRRK